MALIKITTDGSEFEVADEIARDDQRLREALTPFYPELANAEITRSEQEGKLIVTMVKRAGTKGSGFADVLAVLRDSPEEFNPALVLQHKMSQMEKEGKLDLRKILRMQPEIRFAVNEGMKQIEAQRETLKLLREGKPVAGKSISVGF
jgi:hypothetical protein